MTPPPTKPYVAERRARSSPWVGPSAFGAAEAAGGVKVGDERVQTPSSQVTGRAPRLNRCSVASPRRR